jgi:hypothetical protein
MQRQSAMPTTRSASCECVQMLCAWPTDFLVCGTRQWCASNAKKSTRCMNLPNSRDAAHWLAVDQRDEETMRVSCVEGHIIMQTRIPSLGLECACGRRESIAVRCREHVSAPGTSGHQTWCVRTTISQTL